MTLIPRVAALCAALTITGCELADRLEGKSPSRAHIEMRQALITPEPAPEPEPPVAVMTPEPEPIVEAPPPIESDPPPMPVCRFSDAGFLICT